MNIRYSASLLLGTAVFLSTNVIAKEIAIYRWVDENNIVHFSQHQPMDENYSQLTTISSYKASSKKVVTESPGAADSDEAKELAAKYEEQQNIIAKNKETYAKNCNAAQLNVKMLNSFNRILYTDTDGESKVLSGEEKQEKLDVSKKQIALYCEK